MRMRVISENKCENKMNNLTRRTIIGAACGSIFLYPGTSRAQDIIDVLEAASELAGILQQLFGSGGNVSNTDDLQTIFAKLNSIIQSQTVILRDLEALKIEIGNLIQDSDIHSLDGYRTDYASLISQPYSGNYKAQYDQLFHDLSDTCGRLGKDTYAAFTAYACGLAMLLTLAGKMQFGQSYITSIKTTHRPFLQVWLDPANQASISYLTNATRDQFQAGLASLNALPNPQLVDRGPMGSGGSYSDLQACSWEQQLVITGDFNTGYTGAMQRLGYECHTNPYYMPPHPGGMHVLVIPGVDAAVGGNLPDPIRNALKSLPKPQASPSGFPEVDNLNNQRNQLIDEGTRLNSYLLLQAAIQRSLDALT